MGKASRGLRLTLHQLGTSTTSANIGGKSSLCLGEALATLECEPVEGERVKGEADDRLLA